MTDRSSRTAMLMLMSAVALAACGGGSDTASVAPPPSQPPTDAARASAATATATTNPMCSLSAIGTFYWEIGDANGVKVSGSVGPGAPTATTPMKVFSASKWLYAANVVQKRGVLDEDVPYLNFTSGYSNYGNAPICVDDSSVDGCFVGHDGTQDPATIGRFYYDSGHMQQHASAIMNMGSFSDTGLANDLNATLGDFGFSYYVPQLAAGVVVTPQGYAGFLRKMLRGELALAAALGTNKVCANPNTPGCDAASGSQADPNEALDYSLGHWVEDDPTVGDRAFSSAGGGGFYPWIDRDKTYYGIIARETMTESDAGFHSAECGRLVRQAWMTGQAVTSTTPTPY